MTPRQFGPITRIWAFARFFQDLTFQSGAFRPDFFEARRNDDCAADARFHRIPG